MRAYARELKKSIGKSVTVLGWVHDVRLMGGINFLLLRDDSGIVQVTAPKNKVEKKILDVYESMHQEDVVQISGTVVQSKSAPGGFEIIPSEVKVLAKAEVPLPLDPRKVTKANLDTRLDWRYLDLRTLQNSFIFRIQSKLIQGMEEYLWKTGFIQVYTPSLLGGISEGGSEVFPVVYFNRQAYLRQDPQLHRELLIASGFDKIFDIGPSWRAEKSHTVRHLTEHRTIAPEMAFIKDEQEPMKVEAEMVAHALKKIKEECAEELEVIGKKIEVPKLPFPELKFPDVYEILEKLGKKVPFGEDYDHEAEGLLGEFVKKKFHTDFFFVNKFPFAAKPFYVMRVDEDPRWARSVDLIFKGTEISSGGQREHRLERLLQQVREKGLNVESVKWFTDAFRYGVPAMGGYSLGIERFTQKLLDLENIREAVLFTRDTNRLLP